MLPWPPSLNAYYRTVRGRMLISEKGREYRQSVIGEVLQAGSPKVVGRLSVRIGVFPPNKARRDLDNLPKCVLDSLQHAGVYEDDGQIDQLCIERCSVVEEGALRVTVKEIRE